MRDTHSQRDADATDAPHDDHTDEQISVSEHDDHTDDQRSISEHDDDHPAAGDGQRETDGRPRTDGGTATTADAAATDHQDVDYLDREVNIFKPSTPFMRDHLRVVWAMFAAWAVVVFGPVTATALAPDPMTSITVIGFPLHYVTTAIGAPAGALVLSFVYARKRDRLDEKYGIDHGTDAAAESDDPAAEPTAADGGVDG